MPKYDVVVVGAGNAGLAAACTLAKAGKKTLLIEQHNLPGGCATSFRRGRFEFEPSLHEMCDWGPADDPGDVRRMFDDLGVKLEWCQVPDCFRCVSTYSDGTPMDVTMPSGISPFIDAMERYVPGSRPGMEKLFELFEQTLACIGYITASAGHADSAVLKRDYPNVLRTGAYSCQKVFDALKLPRRCQDILSVYWGYLGVDMTRLAFIHYAAMVHKYISRSAYIPKHTSHEISCALTERIRELGGDIWFNCRAEKFLFDGDRLCGVETSMGRVDCDYVLANIYPDILYGKMVPPELIPEREKKLTGARRLYGRMFVSYFGLNKSAEELGLRDYSVFFPQSADSARECASLQRMDTNDFNILVCYNVANPDFSPEGTCVVSFTSMYGAEDWNELPVEDYVKVKNRIARRHIEKLRDTLGVDISDCIEEMAVATPWTFARYLGNPEGCVYGYETADWDGMMARMMMLADDYPLKGLRPIGAAGPRGDGYSSAYVCGQLMARLALKDLAEEGGKQ